VLDNEKIDQLHYKILIYLNNKSEDEIRKMLSFVKSNNRVIAIIKTLAEWDYEIDLEIENVKQLQDFTMQLTKNFSGIIRDYLTIRVIEMPKYNFYP
jgi:DNA-binding Lrp family transcriptional regulator